MKLFTIIEKAQGERAIANMGQAFGLTADLVALAVQYFLPAIVKAVEKRAETQEGLISLLEFFGATRYDRFLDDPRIFTHDRAVEEGERASLFLFQTEARIGKIIANRASVLPVGADDLNRMFPVICLMAVGAIEVRTRRPLAMIASRLNAATGSEQAIANPYLLLARHLKRQDAERSRKRSRLFGFFSSGVREDPRPSVGPIADRSAVKPVPVPA
jgi:hypothetical protein